MALKWLNKIKFCVAVYLLSFSIHAQESDYTSIYNDSIPNKMEFDVKDNHYVKQRLANIYCI